MQTDKNIVFCIKIYPCEFFRAKSGCILRLLKILLGYCIDFWTSILIVEKRYYAGQKTKDYAG